MKIKLDENLAPSLASVFGRAHDVDTVQDEGLSGASDDRLIAACQLEGRALITLDLDFASIVSYPPAQFAGIVVFAVSRSGADLHCGSAWPGGCPAGP